MDEVEEVEGQGICQALAEKYKEKIRELFDLKRDVENAYYNANKSAAELLKQKTKKDGRRIKYTRAKLFK